MTTNNDEWLNDEDFIHKSGSDNIDETNIDETNDENENENESESDSSYDEDYYNPIFPCLSLDTTSTIYSVNKDNEPIFYVKTLEKAREIMWSCAREYRMRWFSNYNTFIREGSDRNIIEITGYYRYFLIAYERLFTTFEIRKIYELLA